MKCKTHTHPNETQYRINQIILACMLGAMIFLSASLVILTFTIPAPLFFFMALVMLALTTPVIMRMVVSPPLTVSDDGIMLHPYIGNERFIAWDDIRDVKDYTLLPAPHNEVVRRMAVGRKNYAPAEGVMLIVETMPLHYRFAGFFAGENAAPIVAVTNRTHTEYERLKSRIEYHTNTTS